MVSDTKSYLVKSKYFSDDNLSHNFLTKNYYSELQAAARPGKILKIINEKCFTVILPGKESQ
jgi:hypothetical protein